MRPCIGCGKTPTCYHAACSTVYCVDCINGILDAVHGMSSQGVEACVEAVRAGRDYSVHKVSNQPDGSKEYLDWCLEEAAIRQSSLSLMAAAIALLPKEGT